jgi:hypothetical protein
MTNDRDYQRSKVYAWEECFVAPRDPSSIKFAQAQGVVDATWAEMGLRFPPKVERLPRQARSTVADATRLSIRLTEPSPSWYLLHELAHAMSSTHDGQSDGHGPMFMGLYGQLLIRYLRVPAGALLKTLNAAGIEADMQAKPSFVDDKPMGRNPTDHRHRPDDYKSSARSKCSHRSIHQPASLNRQHHRLAAPVRAHHDAMIFARELTGESAGGAINQQRRGDLARRIGDIEP